MSGDSAVKVVFGADATGLDSAVAVAKARLQQFNSEVRSLAKEAASAGGATNDNLAAALKEATANAASAQREVNSLARAVKESKGAFDEHTKSVGVNRIQQMEAMHVAKALADEIAAGQSPLRALAMEAGRIGEIFAMGIPKISPFAAIATGAGVAAGAIALLAFQARKSSIEIESLSKAMNFSGISGASSAEIEKLTKSVRSIKNTESMWSGVWDYMAQISTEDANKIVSAFATMRNGSTQLMGEIVPLISEYAAATRNEIPKASEILIKAFEDPLNQGEKLKEIFPNVTSAQRRFYEEAARSGNIVEAQNALLKILSDALGKGAAASIAAAEAALRDKQAQLERKEAYAAALDSSIKAAAGADHSIGVLKVEIATLERELAALRANDAARIASVPTIQQWGRALEEAIKSAGGDKLDELTGKLQKLQGAMKGVSEASGAGEGPLGGWWTKERQSHAIDRLQKEAGLSQWGASGLVARWGGVEAGGGPASVNPDSGAFGIGQWLGGREKGILGNTDFDAQISHAVAELNGAEKAAGDALRKASNASDAARGASMFERAEGYSKATGEDNFTAKTPVRRVYAEKFGGVDENQLSRASEAAASLKDQILSVKQAREGGTEIDKAELANLQSQLAGKRDELQEQERVVEGIQKQLDLTSSTAERTKLQVQLDSARLALADRQAAAKRAELQLEVGRAESGAPENRRDTKVALAEFDMSRYAEDTAQYKQALAQKEAAHRAYEQEQQQATRVEIDGELAALGKSLSQKQTLYDEETKLKLISEDKKLEMTRAALNEEYAAEMALLQKELALNNQKPQQIQAVNNKIRALEEKHADDLEKVNRQGVERMVQPWHQLIDQISSSFSGSVMGLLEGTKKFSDAVRDMARTVIQHFVQMGVQAVADWAKGIATQVALTISGQQLQTAAVGAGIAERAGLEAGGAAVSIATKATSVIKALAQDAAEVFGGVFAFLAPIMGPAAAAPAGAAAATVAAAKFETGSWYIPHTGLAVLHEGEGVLTAGQNARLHNFMGYIEKGGAGGGNTFHVRPQVNFNVSAADHRDVARWLNGSGRDVMKTIEKQVRLGSHLGMKGLGPA